MYARSVDLQSPDFLAAFRQRTAFVLNNPFLVKEYSDRERGMLEAVSQMPRGDYSGNARRLKTTYPADELEGLARKVMRAARGSLASTDEGSRNSSISSESGLSVSSEEMVPPPVVKRVTAKVDPVAGRMRREVPPPPRRGPAPGLKQARAPSPIAVKDDFSKPPSSPPPPIPVAVSPRRVVSLPMSPKPLKKQRSFIETGSAVDLLKIQREYEIAVQGAICLKFLFPEAHKKLFPKEEDQRVVDGVIRTHGLMRFVGFLRERAVDEVFRDPPENLFSVLHRLGKQQTLSQIVKPPCLKDFPPLPPIFLRDPRLKPERLEDLLDLIGKVRYQCLGIYTTMPEALRRTLNGFCASVFIKEMIGWPLIDCMRVALRGNYPSDRDLDLLIRTVTLSDSLSPVETPPQPPRPQRSVEEVFAHPFLRFPILFRQLLKHVARFRQEDRLSFFAKQIEAAHRLKEEALFPHEAAIERCFGKGALERHFMGEDSGRMVERALEELDRLAPHPLYEHPLLNTERGIALLKERSQGDLQGYFRRVEEVMRENPGMPPFLAVQAVFTRTALRLFFDSERDSENGAAFIKLIDEAAGEGRGAD